uniref:Uncharacterized protein n=1 Tax=Oryza rufipogon TaxID=4529 RepID=A0A0E0NNW6_ORYRU
MKMSGTSEISARKIIHKEALLPDHSAYTRVIKDLHKIGKGDLDAELKLIFQKLTVHAESAQ